MATWNNNCSCPWTNRTIERPKRTHPSLNSGPRRLGAVLKVGDAAPDFVLEDSDGRSVRLSSFIGNPVVLFFYPKDHTPGCTIEAQRFRQEHDAIQEAGGVVLGVSMDDADSHCSFRDKHDLPFHLLADLDGHVHDLYDAWRTKLFGRNSLGVRRCTYLIDSDGIIRRVYKTINVLGHAKKVREDLELLVHPS